MSTTPEFSIFNEFDATSFNDRLFRNQKDGIRLQASYTFSSGAGESTTRIGVYTKEDGQYVFKRGFDTIGYFWADGDESSLDADALGAPYYADQVAYAFLNELPHNVSMQVKFIPEVKKSNGAPF